MTISYQIVLIQQSLTATNIGIRCGYVSEFSCQLHLQLFSRIGLFDSLSGSMRQNCRTSEPVKPNATTAILRHVIS